VRGGLLGGATIEGPTNKIPDSNRKIATAADGESAGREKKKEVGGRRNPEISQQKRRKYTEECADG